MVLCFYLSSPVIFLGYLARISVHLQKEFLLRAFRLCSYGEGHILWSYAQNGLLHLSLAVLLSPLLFDCVQKDNSMKCNYLYRHYLEPLREWIRFLSQSQFPCSLAITSLSLNQSVRLAQKRVCPLEILCFQLSENSLFRRL